MIPKLQNIVLDAKIKLIDKYSFEEASVVELTVPPNVTIESGAVKNCNEITTVHSFNFGTGIFGCTKLKNIYYCSKIPPSSKYLDQIIFLNGRISFVSQVRVEVNS